MAVIALLVVTSYIVYEVLSSDPITLSTAVKDACRSGDPLCELSSDSDVASDVSSDSSTMHVIITFTNARSNAQLRSKFGVTVETLFRHATRHVTLYVIGDTESQLLAEEILHERVQEADKYSVSLGRSLVEILEKLEVIDYL